mgnify:CR=1 FL=1
MLGDKEDITLDDLSQLVYTGCVFKESMRKWPPVAEVFRVTNSIDLNIAGYRIPVRASIIVYILTSQPEIFRLDISYGLF